MDLLVTLRGGLADGRVEVTVPDGATIGALAARLAGDEAVAAGGGLLTLDVAPLSYGRGTGPITLDPDVEVRLSGLRSGDEVTPVPAVRRAVDDPVAALHVVHGPEEGRTFALRPGTNVVGRESGSQVRLSDPLVAGRHASVHVGQRIEVRDLGSTGGISVAGTPATRAPWRDAETLALGSTVLRLQTGSPPAGRTGDVPVDLVTGAPRALPPLPQDPVEIPAPPDAPEVRRMPRAALLAPALMGLAMFAMTGRAISLVFVVMSPLVMLAGVLDSRGERRRRLKEAAERFDAELDSAAREIDVREPQERAALEARFPSTSDARAAAGARGSCLWARRPEHGEHLVLRLGAGQVDSAAPPHAPSGGSAISDAKDRARALADRGAIVRDAPVTAALRSCGSLGLAGHGATAVARALLVQLAALHSPTDCRIAILGGEDGRPDPWDWAAWLPHVRAGAALLGRSAQAHGTDRAPLLDAVERLVAERAGADLESLTPQARTVDEPATPCTPGRPSLVVVVDDSAAVGRERLIRVAELGPDHGVHLIWVASEPSHVPGACRTILRSDRAGGAVVAHALRGGPETVVVPESCSAAAAEETARMLAPLVDAAAITSTAAGTPREVPLLALHGADVLDPRLHAARWRASRAGDARGSLRALVGQSGDGPAYLDLAREGPHALVGGTTGSGKSELLQAWILGMACAHGPDAVTFLLVDYKGGAAFADCVRLPHAVGLVTDLDPRLAARVLASLRAELVRRERILAAAGAKDIDALLASGAPAPPRLVVAIDEFATLVAEVPAFVDGVLDIAQRGRSLGLHLIMATQRPAGVIRDSLRANTNLRLALRMADDADSRDVIGDAAAARLDPGAPGRVLVRAGSAPARVVQSAYGGASTADHVDESPPILVRDATSAVAGVWEGGGAREPAPAFATDASRVVDALRAAHALAGAHELRRPWLDELPRCLALEDLPRSKGRLVVGRSDDPAHQSQAPLAVDLDADGGVLIVSGPGAGASTALRAFAAAAVAMPGAEPTRIYGIDGAGGGLAPLRALPHVGDIVDHDDAERVARLLDILAALVRDRRAEATDAGPASTRASFRVLLLVDDAAQLQAGCLHVPGREKVWSDLRTVIADGRSVGIHVAMTASRSGALHASIRVLMSRLLVLRTADEAEYALAGLRSARVSPEAPPGRGIDASSGLEIQFAAPGGSPRLDVQARALAELAADFDGPLPPRVPRMPRDVDPASVPAHVDGLPVIGVEQESLAPLAVDVDRAFVIAGPAGSGRTSALAWLASAMRAAHPDDPVVHLSLRRSAWGGSDVWTESHVGVDAGAEFLARWARALAAPADVGERVVVVVEHLEDLGPGSPDHGVVQALRQALRAGHVVIAEAETHAWVGPLASDMRAARCGLVLAAEPSDVQVLLGARGPRLPDDRPPGRGILVQPGATRVVQVPRVAAPLSTDGAAASVTASTRG